MRGGLRSSGHALWMSGVVIALSCLWRGGITILFDVGGNVAHDFLGGVLGRTGEWLILAAAMVGYAVYIRRKHRFPGSSPSRNCTRWRCRGSRELPSRHLSTARARLRSA